MKIGNIDFNEKLIAGWKKPIFNKFWKSGKYEDKTGVKSEDAYLKFHPKKED